MSESSSSSSAKSSASQPSAAEPSNRSEPNLFEQEAGQSRLGILGEFWEFLRTNKKWWLTPIILVIVLLTLFGILSQSVIAPSIYPLF